MTQRSFDSSEAGDESLPQALRRLDAPPFSVPPEVDASILSAARAGFARRRRWRLAARWAVSGAAAAAVLAVAVRVGVLRSTPPAFAHGDLNHDGKVDIVDAFTLARMLAAGEKPPASWDMNGDGIVDEKDVQWLASQAVRVEVNTQ